eukprot:CAMPEP_0202444764 /NCGR_PEP_ID=MMETSP1360-20130828/3713_1 /ASSEMBLY_ACC=CAM_ASM_000848 /TAXON_ID=515479 /ORGANISM="Licmophora paradoxa, Strain CCMP2313" /LENGTH=87 /DNA_ID=CAMNT_0049060815 /DNA_START=368 /DNA_END=631 /DNA_ORIENTATION=+
MGLVVGAELVTVGDNVAIVVGIAVIVGAGLVDGISDGADETDGAEIVGWGVGLMVGNENGLVGVGASAIVDESVGRGTVVANEAASV